ncbi:MAG: hypothetical protein QXH91_09250 [Candidatus Bathyarchaeia archaeon]
MFIYEYEIAGEPNQKELRRRSLKAFREEFKKFDKIVSAIPSTELIYMADLVAKIKEKRMPILRVNPRALEEFSENYGLKEANLDKLYSACSSVIHNQPPLPFFSLLEVKFFKHFLERYVDSFQKVAEKLINMEIGLKKKHMRTHHL